MTLAFLPTVKTGQLKPHRLRLFVHGGRRASEMLRAPEVVPGCAFTGGGY
jgi:hypothetical protein